MTNTGPKAQPTDIAQNGPALSKATRWDVVICGLVVGFIAGMQIGKVPPAIPDLRDDLGLSLIAAGWIASFFTFAGACFGALIGLYADRLGPRRAASASLAAMGFGSLLGGFAGDAWLLLIGRGFESLGFIGIAVSAPRLMVLASAEKDRNLIFGIWGTYVPGGMAISMLIAPLIIPTEGWRGLWLTTGVIAIVGYFMFLWMTGDHRWKKPSPSPGSTVGLGSLRLVLAEPGAWLLAISFMLYSFQFLAFMSWVPTFLIERLDLSIGVAALTTALIVAANMIGNVCAGFLLALGAARPLLLIIAFVGMAAGSYVAFAENTGGTLLIAAAFFFSAIGGLIPGTLLAATPIFAPRPNLIGALNGMMMQGSNIGSLSGPPLMALVVSSMGGWEVGYLQSIAGGAIGCAAALALWKLQKSRASSRGADQGLSDS